MTAARPPIDEAARLATLHRYGVLDTPAEQEYDDIAQLAAQICDTAIGLVSLTDIDRQWMKATFGFELPEIPRDGSFCDHAIRQREPDVLVVEDAANDPRFAASAAVTEIGLRFYVGAPIVAPNGHVLGTVCVLDRQPRTATSAQVAGLTALSRQVVALLELRQQLRTRDQLNASLHETSELLLESQSLARVGGWSLDIATHELEWTDETYRIHDATPRSFVPTVEQAIGFYVPSYVPVIEAAVKNAIASAQPFDHELELITTIGRRIWVRATGRPLVENGQVTRVVGAFQDITAVRTAAAELLEAKEAAEAANEAKGRFLATMSHEIRTPMNAVIGYTNLLESTPLDETQREYLRIIERSGQALMALINDVLDYAQIEADRVEIEAIDFDLHESVNDIARMLAPTAIEKRIELRAVVSNGLPRFVNGDITRLGQVLLNLINNAVKFTERGSVTLAAQPVADADDRIRFEVRDTGIGIAQDRIGQLFEEFTQADASTRRRFGGTGLGLAISRRIVELMGGEIGASSTVGRGSTFWFTVPLPASKSAATAEDPQGASNETDPAVESTAGRRHVLLAEDNPINQRLAREFLTAMGCDVTVVDDGAQAVEAVSQTDYSLVLMDCLMPEMDGFEATRLIRELERKGARPATPIVALTANAQPGDRERCREAGMDDHLGKPFRRSDLEHVIATWSRVVAAVD